MNVAPNRWPSPAIVIACIALAVALGRGRGLGLCHRGVHDSRGLLLFSVPAAVRGHASGPGSLRGLRFFLITSTVIGCS